MNVPDGLETLASGQLNSLQKVLKNVYFTAEHPINISTGIQIEEFDGVYSDDLDINCDNYVALTFNNCHFDKLTILANAGIDLRLVDCNIGIFKFQSKPEYPGQVKVDITARAAKSCKIEELEIRNRVSMCSVNKMSLGGVVIFHDKPQFVSHVSMTEVDVKKDILLIGSQIHLEVGTQSVLEKDIVGFGDLASSRIKVENVDIKGNVSLTKGNSNAVEIIDSKVAKVIAHSQTGLKLTFLGSQTSLINLTRCILSRVRIDRQEEPSEEIYIRDITVDHTTLDKGHFSVTGYALEKINLSFFRNPEGEIKFENCKIHSTLFIYNSHLGKAIFQNIYMSLGVNFSLLYSTVTEAKFYTVNWMEGHRLVENNIDASLPLETKIDYYLSLKESYRQLKAISLSALNRFDALNFQKHEQRMQRKILWLKGEYADTVLLWTNEVFNNYGLSYLKPLGFLFAFHLLWYSILVVFGGVFNYNSALITGTFSWELTANGFSDYLYTIFPLHDTEYLCADTGWRVIVDIAMRVTSGYFIYYFISATRKFHLT